MNLPRILVVDDQFSRDIDLQELLLHNAGFVLSGANIQEQEKATAEVEFCSGQRETDEALINDYEVIREVVEKGWDLVLLDARFDSGPVGEDGTAAGGSKQDETFGEEVRQQLARDFPNQPVVMFTDKTQEELQDDHGDGYVAKAGLTARGVRRELLKHGHLSADQVARLLDLSADVICESPAMRQVFLKAFRLADTDTSVLLLGDSGVGKEEVAEYLHRLSRRCAGPLLAVNLGALAKDMVESELFGHVRGAFTSAHRDKKGIFEQAQSGTLFLDEIGEMPADAQVKLLRALESGTITRVGDEREIKIDVRVIAATNRDIREAIAGGTFREDLYHRVAVTSIQIPNLSERREDIVPLARHFLGLQMAANGKQGMKFSEEAETRLRGHEFTGNVRQLNNVVASLVASEGNNRLLGVEVIDEELGSGRQEPSTASTVVVAGNNRIVGAGQMEQALGETRDSVDGRGTSPKPPSGPGPGTPAQTDLETLFALLNEVAVDSGDPALKGAKPRLDAAVETLTRKLTGAALELYRNPSTRVLNRQGAVRYLMDDLTLKGKEPKRILNQVLGCPQDADLTDEQLETLVRLSESGSTADDEQ